MNKLILASDNAHKLKEIQAILSDFGFELITMRAAGYGDEEIVEDGDTFEANSHIKAKAVFDKLNCASLADDSGLSVDALDGAPGVYSARYAGEPKSDQKNNEKLLNALKNVEDAQRTAKFVTVITLILENGETFVARGEVKGVIGHAPKGSNGFGYDPLFIVPELGKTFAELQDFEKNELSHRANALKVLKEMLETYYENIGHQ